MVSSTTTKTSDSENSKSSSCLKGHWSPGEDEKLLQLVKQHGPQNWNSIADKMQWRSGKSCRLRWFNQLDPRINERPFTAAEEDRLLEAHAVHGNRWALISRIFPSRTDNAVKNHWHVLTARRHRHCHHQGLLAQAGEPSFRLSSSSSSSSSQQPFRYFSFHDTSPAAASSFWNALSKPGGFRASTTTSSLEAKYHNKQETMTTPLPLSMAFSHSREAMLVGHRFYKINNHEKDHVHIDLGPASKRKDVPFFEFLGVGVSS